MHLASTSPYGDRRARSTPRAATAISFVTLLASASLAPGAYAGNTPGPLRACAAARRAGPDTSAVGGSRPIGLDRGLAQSFTTTDTLVRAISVWLPGTARNLSFPLHLYVTRADASGRPLPDARIADGGVLRAGLGRGMQPARFVFEFSPPLTLPEAGTYAFVLMPDDCGIVSLLTTPGDAMPDGQLWEVGRRGCLDPPTAVRSEVNGRDLVYEIEYCDRGTRAPSRTWGEIRTRYR